MLKKILFVSLALSLIPVLAYGCVALPTGLGPTNQMIKHTVELELLKLDFDLAGAAVKLSTTGLSGTETSSILSEFATEHPSIINICTADTSGNIVTVGVDAYKNYEGVYIATENVTAPVLTPMFRAVEGMDAVALMRPITSENGDIIGAVSMIFKPETLFTSPTEEQFTIYFEHWKDTLYSIDVFQLDGLDIYDSTGHDTGTNLFTDPAAQQFPDLIALGHRMIAEETGSGSYTNIDPATGKTVKKEAYWSTVKLHDTAWRIMSAEVVE
jgi:branched-chain amino acid transport system substrate-binding protein